jgi:hypothetical protein
VHSRLKTAPEASHELEKKEEEEEKDGIDSFTALSLGL